MASKNWSPFAGWLTGWFNLLGQARYLAHKSLLHPMSLGPVSCYHAHCRCLGMQVAVTAGIDFTLASHIAAMIAISNGHICSQVGLRVSI